MIDDARPARLVARAIHKRYAAPVLRGVDLTLQGGQVHALLGANGAGKSTLGKIIAGLVRSDEGSLALDGIDFAPRTKAAAERRGVHIVQQELNLIPTLSVAENLRLSDLPSRWGIISRRRLWDDADAALHAVGLDAVDPRTPLARLGVGQRQLVEIASALRRHCRVLVLDEPTAALTDPQVDVLFERLEELRRRDVAMLYVSHRLDEIRRIADRVSILRDGECVLSAPRGQWDLDRAVQAMLGRSLAQLPPPPTRSLGPVALQVRDLRTRTGVDGVSFDVRRGEILGIGGLVGAKRTELLRAIFGADPVESGRVTVPGRSATRPLPDPAAAVQAGIALVPEDRRHQGLLMPRSILVNTVLGNDGRAGARLGWIRAGRVRNFVGRAIQDAEVACASLEQPVATLSGGNQQKVLVARWLETNADVYLFDEPTRGIDVGAKRTLYQILRRLAEAGKAVVVVSSDLDELMAIADRIGVMLRGRIAEWFSRADFDRKRLLAAAVSSDAVRGAPDSREVAAREVAAGEGRGGDDDARRGGGAGGGT